MDVTDGSKTFYHFYLCGNSKVKFVVIWLSHERLAMTELDITMCIVMVLMNGREVSIHDKSTGVGHSEIELNELPSYHQEWTNWSGSSAQLFGKLIPG